MKKDFNQWLSTFRESIANYKYYVDFDTVYSNYEDIKVGDKLESFIMEEIKQ